MIKKCYILLIIFSCLFSISAVSASVNVTADIVGVDEANVANNLYNEIYGQDFKSDDVSINQTILANEEYLDEIAMGGDNYDVNSSKMSDDFLSISSNPYYPYYPSYSDYSVNVYDTTIDYKYGGTIQMSIYSYSYSFYKYYFYLKVYDSNGYQKISREYSSTSSTYSKSYSIGAYALSSGTYMIKIFNHYDNVVMDTAKLIVEDTSYLLSAPDITKYYGGSERFVVTLNDENDNPINNANIKISINGQDYIRTTDNRGYTSIAINLNSGIYHLTTSYEDTKVYSTVTINPTVVSHDFSKIFKNDTQYYGNFTDSRGNLLKNTPVEFNINGVYYTRTTNNQGIAKMNINLNPGTYILTAKNPVTNEMQSSTITVLSSIVENHDLVKYYKNDSQYRVRLLDGQGRPVGKGVNIEFNINGVFYTRSSDEYGYVQMNINLDPGNYIITANYNGLMASNWIMVLPILYAKDVIMNYQDGSKFEVSLFDGQGNPYSGQTISFNINGVLYDRITDSNGIASLNINIGPGNYIITSSYDTSKISNEIIVNPTYQPTQQSSTNHNQQSSSTKTYIGNTNSKIFHNPSCPSVKKMKSSNKITFYSRNSAINSGYRPCKNCNP